MIELLIALGIAAFLVVLALPNYSAWVADAQIQGAAESIASGLRYAQAEAIKQNEQVEVVVDTTSGTGGWTASRVSDGQAMQAGVFAETSKNVSFFMARNGAIVPATTVAVTFSPLGQILDVNADGNARFDRIRVTSPIAGTRKLCVYSSDPNAAAVAPLNTLPSYIKMCDPKWPSTDPKGCPLRGVGQSCLVP